MNITHRLDFEGQHEAILELCWFTGTGSYNVRATGLGSSPEAAEKEARLHLGQARSQLNEVTAKEPA